MELVNSSFEVLDTINGVDILKKIETAGRVCYKSEDKITDSSCLKFVADIIKRGHESVLEHEKITVRAICDRGVSHEIVRHRVASYSQESTRYCNYGKSDHLTFIIPSWLDLREGLWDYFDTAEVAEQQLGADVFEWLESMLVAEVGYLRLLELGWRPEQARSVLPNSLKTEIVMTMNLREWRHFFKLRTAKAAHPDMQSLAIPMLNYFKIHIPIVFDDIDL